MSIVNNPFLKNPTNAATQSKSSTTYFKPAPVPTTSSNFFAQSSNIPPVNNDSKTANLINNNPFFASNVNNFSQNTSSQSTLNNFFTKTNPTTISPSFPTNQTTNVGINSYNISSTSDNLNTFSKFPSTNTFQNPITNTFQSSSTNTFQPTTTTTNNNFFSTTNKWNNNLQSITEVNEEIDLASATLYKSNPRIVECITPNSVPERILSNNISILPHFCEFQIEELRAFNNFKKRSKLLPVNSIEKYQHLSNEGRINVFKADKYMKENFSETDLKKLEKWSQDYMNGKRDNFLDFLVKPNFNSTNNNTSNQFFVTNPLSNNDYFSKPQGITTNPSGTTWGTASTLPPSNTTTNNLWNSSSNTTSNNTWNTSSTQIKSINNNNNFLSNNAASTTSTPNLNFQNSTNINNVNNTNSWNIPKPNFTFPSSTSNQVTQNVQTSWGKPPDCTFPNTNNNISSNNFSSTNNPLWTPSLGNNNMTNSASNYFKTSQNPTSFGTGITTTPPSNFGSTNAFPTSNQFPSTSTTTFPVTNSNYFPTTTNTVASNTFSSGFPYTKNLPETNFTQFGNNIGNGHNLSWNVPNTTQINNFNHQDYPQLQYQSETFVSTNNQNSMKDLLSKCEKDWECNDLNNFVSKPTFKEQIEEIKQRNKLDYEFFPNYKKYEYSPERKFTSMRRHERDDYVKPGREISPSDRDPEMFLQKMKRELEKKQSERDRKPNTNNDSFFPRISDTFNLKRTHNPNETSVLSKNFGSKNNRPVTNNDLEKEFNKLVESKGKIPVRITSKSPKPFNYIIELSKSYSLCELKTVIGKFLEKKKVFDNLRIDFSDFTLFMENDFCLIESSINFEELIKNNINEIFKTGVNYVISLNMLFSMKFKEKYNKNNNAYSKIFKDDEVENCIVDNDENNQKNSNKIAEKEDNFVPQNPKNFKTKPDLETFKKMDKNRLGSIKNFEVWNEYGKIKFLDPVDLTYINLDNISIEKGQIFIDKLESDMKKLNKRAELEMYGVNDDEDIQSDKGLARLVRNLEERCKEIGATFLGFEKNGNVLRFAVNKMKF